VIRRGSLVLVALSGDYGKPRPALVVQTDLGDNLPSLVVLPLTTTIREDLLYLRTTIEPTPGNGLRERSQVMIDKPAAATRAKLGEPIGVLDAGEMAEVTRSLAILLGIV